MLIRGNFGNIRLRNGLVAGREDNWTEHLPSGEVTSIYEAAMRYRQSGTPLVLRNMLKDGSPQPLPAPSPRGRT